MHLWCLILSSLKSLVSIECSSICLCALTSVFITADVTISYNNYIKLLLVPLFFHVIIIILLSLLLPLLVPSCVSLLLGCVVFFVSVCCKALWIDALWVKCFINKVELS